ncbi:MAG: hypothetical protein LBQ48_07825 [Oscillospiraceae bacterium]|jgi:hypothetical protein|nr:hypothetical protein [Oscillospiraceae bacterium]
MVKHCQHQKSRPKIRFLKQLFLPGVALLLFCVLCVGGTLMIFLAQSDQATNTWSTTGMAVQLWESGEQGESSIPETLVTDVDPDGLWDVPTDTAAGVFKGIDFAALTPGSSFTKTPYLRNPQWYKETASGAQIPSSNMFVRVLAKFYVWDSAGTLVSDTVGGVSTADLFGCLRDGTGWVFVPPSADNGYVGTYYYGTQTGEGEPETAALTVLAPGVSTTPVFTTVRLDADAPSALAGKRISLTLTAQAVQSNGNEGTPFSGAFSTAFGGTLSSYITVPTVMNPADSSAAAASSVDSQHP